jgi:hypothetical protein
MMSKIPMIYSEQFGKEVPLTTLLFALAGQAGLDGDEGRAMHEAAEEIGRLRALQEADDE